MANPRLCEEYWKAGQGNCGEAKKKQPAQEPPEHLNSENDKRRVCKERPERKEQPENSDTDIEAEKSKKRKAPSENSDSDLDARMKRDRAAYEAAML